MQIKIKEELKFFEQSPFELDETHTYSGIALMFIIALRSLEF